MEKERERECVFVRVRGKKERWNKPRCVVSEKERGREKARRKN